MKLQADIVTLNLLHRVRTLQFSGFNVSFERRRALIHCNSRLFLWDSAVLWGTTFRWFLHAHELVFQLNHSFLQVFHLTHQHFNLFVLILYLFLLKLDLCLRTLDTGAQFRSDKGSILLIRVCWGWSSRWAALRYYPLVPRKLRLRDCARVKLGLPLLLNNNVREHLLVFVFHLLKGWLKHFLHLHHLVAQLHLHILHFLQQLILSIWCYDRCHMLSFLSLVLVLNLSVAYIDFLFLFVSVLMRPLFSCLFNNNVLLSSLIQSELLHFEHLCLIDNVVLQRS